MCQQMHTNMGRKDAFSRGQDAPWEAILLSWSTQQLLSRVPSARMPPKRTTDRSVLPVYVIVCAYLHSRPPQFTAPAAALASVR